MNKEKYHCIDCKKQVIGKSKRCLACYKKYRNSKKQENEKTHKNGYKMIYCPDHPRANNSGYVMEHIIIMETIIGRPILPIESIHHKNGFKDDNRPENLELWATQHRAGQRVNDIVLWAKEILITHENPSDIISWAIGHGLKSHCS